VPGLAVPSRIVGIGMFRQRQAVWHLIKLNSQYSVLDYAWNQPLEFRPLLGHLIIIFRGQLSVGAIVVRDSLSHATTDSALCKQEQN
jgi:hypothetical protein